MSSNMTSALASDYIVAGVLMTSFGVIGTSINIAVILALMRTPSFHNAFGYICTLHLIANIGELLIFCLWDGPATILQLDASVTDTFFVWRIAQVYFFCWFCSLYSDLQIAINRLVAIGWPLVYSKSFSGRRFIYFSGSFCLLSLAHALAFSTYDCSLWYDSTIFIWHPRPTDCGYITIYYTVGVHVVCVCALILIIDTITFYCIWKTTKNLRYSNRMQSEHERRMLKKNISFYVQGCVQNVVQLLATLSFLVPSNFASTRLQMFLTSTLNWELAHMSYSIILVLFNQPLRELLSAYVLLKRKPIIMSTAVVSNVPQILRSSRNDKNDRLAGNRTGA